MALHLWRWGLWSGRATHREDLGSSSLAPLQTKSDFPEAPTHRAISDPQEGLHGVVADRGVGDLRTGMREGEIERWAVPTFEGTALTSMGRAV